MNAPAPQDRPSPPPRAPSAATGRALTFLTGLSLAALTLALTAREVVQIDPWFHIAAGRWILEHLARDETPPPPRVVTFALVTISATSTP